MWHPTHLENERLQALGFENYVLNVAPPTKESPTASTGPGQIDGAAKAKADSRPDELPALKHQEHATLDQGCHTVHDGIVAQRLKETPGLPVPAWRLGSLVARATGSRARDVHVVWIDVALATARPLDAPVVVV